MLTNERIQQLKDYIYREFRTDNVDVDERKFDDISDCLDELLFARQRIAELEGEDDGSEKCMSCGCMVESVWHTTDELWLKYAGFGNLGGVLCMRCFNKKFYEAESGKPHGILYWDAHLNGDFWVYKIAELEAENRELREGLKYYARPDNYGIGGGNINKIICDAGKVAKALLEKYPQRKAGAWEAEDDYYSIQDLDIYDTEDLGEDYRSE